MADPKQTTPDPAMPDPDPTPAPQPFMGLVRPMTPEEIRLAEAAEQARIHAEVAERDIANGPEGGRYMVDGRLVDANGEPIKGEK